jgi:hypothetical protein
MGLSLLQELEAERDAVRRAEVKDAPVQPRNQIVVRFRPPADPDALTPMLASYRATGVLPLEQQKQLVYLCHEEIGRGVTDAGDLIPFDTAGPLRFDGSDERWGPDVQSAHDCVAKLYNLDMQPAALAGLCDALIDWLQGVDAAVLARAEGKSASGDLSSQTPPASISTGSTGSDTSE